METSVQFSPAIFEDESFPSESTGSSEIPLFLSNNGHQHSNSSVETFTNWEPMNANQDYCLSAKRTPTAPKQNEIDFPLEHSPKIKNPITRLSFSDLCFLEEQKREAAEKMEELTDRDFDSETQTGRKMSGSNESMLFGSEMNAQGSSMVSSLGSFNTIMEPVLTCGELLDNDLNAPASPQPSTQEGTPVKSTPVKIEAYLHEINFATAASPAKDPASSSSKCCNCKKSKCLKLYCECFAAGTYCQGCNCENCHNLAVFEAERIAAKLKIKEKNPGAYRHHRMSEEQNPETSLSACEQSVQTKVVLSISGCRCSKSGCKKKYCECYKNGTKCTSLCNCVGCKNTLALKAIKAGNKKNQRKVLVALKRKPALVRADSGNL